eukprot:5679369-Pyramimonas_sp.AAC.1
MASPLPVEKKVSGCPRFGHFCFRGSRGCRRARGRGAPVARSAGKFARPDRCPRHKVRRILWKIARSACFPQTWPQKCLHARTC